MGKEENYLKRIGRFKKKKILMKKKIHLNKRNSKNLFFFCNFMQGEPSHFDREKNIYLKIYKINLAHDKDDSKQGQAIY